MLPKERIQTALNHQEPDRIPMAIWGGSYGIVDSLYKKLVKMLNIGELNPPIRQGHSVNHIDDRLLEALDIDTRYIWPGASPSDPTYLSANGELIYDDFGQPWKRTYPYYSATDGILRNAQSISDIENLVRWPDVNDPRWMVGVTARAEFLKESEYFIIGRMVVSHGPYQMACDLRGTENFMMDMMTEPEFAAALLNRITDTIIGLTENYLKASGESMDMIELPGDDYAANDNLIFSPRLFRQLIKPCLKMMVTKIHRIRPDIKIMFHSDGAIGKLIPDFIDLGIDIVHPLEPVSGMDPAQIKAEYGDKINFLGGVDISHALPGTIEDVRNDVDRCLRDLAPGGGYILAPCNHLQADVPPENVIELYRYAKESGQYSKF